MSIVFFGTPLFAVPSLLALIESGEDVAAVVTRKDKRRGRRGGMTPSPVKEAALERGIRVLEPDGMRDEGFLGELEAIGPEFITVVAYGRILTPAVLAVPTLAPVNLHASLLPMYRGASPIAWAVINGETETGLTTMLITEGLDEGDIILQERFGIEDGDTTGSLSLRLAEAGGPLLVRTQKGLRDGTLRGRPQTGETYYAPLLKKGDGHIPWSGSAREIYNFVRGMHPWPGAFCHIGGRRIKVHRVRPMEGEGAPGVVREVLKDALTVGTGEGLIALLELQPEGRRPMTTGEYLRGRRLREGERIT